MAGLLESQEERDGLMTQPAQVVALYTAQQAGAAMRSHPWVEAVPGVGIVGDRYATGQGHWSDPQWPHQELTLVEEKTTTQVVVLDDGCAACGVTTRVNVPVEQFKEIGRLVMPS